MSARLSRIDAFERRPLFLQVLPRDKLHQYQDAQGDAQQEDQPDDPMLVSQVEWGERQHTAFQSPHALLDQVFASIGGDDLLEAHRLPVVIGRVDAPAQAPHGLFQRALINASLNAHTRGADGLRRALPGAAFSRFMHGGAHCDAHDFGDVMFGDYRFGGLTRFSLVGESRLPLLPFVERIELIRGALGTLA